VSTLLERTRHACARLNLPPLGAIVVACSGGPDSAAALSLLRAALPNAKLIACYVDHGMRPRACIRRDIAAVRAQARAERADVSVTAVEPPAPGESKEAAARERRYAALARLARAAGASFVVTGHHADDVAESFVLALLRGSGLDGAAAMPVRRPLDERTTLARPFLWAQKSDLDALVRSRALATSRDETNIDLRIRRNAVRRWLERLEALAPGSRRAIARSAALLAGDKRLLAGVTKAAWRRCRAGACLSAKSLRALPPQLLARVVRFAVAQAGARTVRDFHRVHCAAIVRAIKRGRGGTYYAGTDAHVVLSAGKLKVVDGRLKTTATARSGGRLKPSAAKKITVPAVGKVTKARLPNGALELWWERPGAAHPSAMHLDGARLPPGSQLTVRLPKPGDACVPSGRRRAVPLARFLAKSGVPKDERAAVALLCKEGQIAAALGIRVMEPFAAKNKQLIAIRWQPAADI